ncbi:MAG: hypothetical protein GY820_13865 [Gammaproteobacteria bacterium]|nr:hypothetical protein [Gammaproteobacteria bacterium]
MAKMAKKIYRYFSPFLLFFLAKIDGEMAMSSPHKYMWANVANIKMSRIFVRHHVVTIHTINLQSEIIPCYPITLYIAAPNIRGKM